MAGKTFSGSYTSTIVLNTPGQNPATLTGSVTVSGISASSDSGIYSNSYGPWSVTNLGRITATGDTSYGILLLTGGTIQNGVLGTPGIIQSDETGVLLTGTASRVNNAGTITGTLGRGVFLQDGGTVVNGGVNMTDAAIIGGFEGVAIYNTGGSLTNFGTILDTGIAGLGVQMYAGTVKNQSSGTIAGVYGVGFVADYTPGTLTNSGIIIGNARDGVELSGGGAVTNTGSIIGAIAGILALYGTTSVSNTGAVSGVYAGIDLLQAGSVVNQAGGTIGGGFGVSMGNGPEPGLAGSVTNSGVITASTYQGVSLNAGGAVINAGSIYGRAAGVAAFYGLATLTNTGSIGSMFVGVDLLAGGTISNAAGATIAGSYGIVLANGVLTGQAAPPSSLSNAGQIAASTDSGVELLTNGSFVNQAGGTISGGTYGVYIKSVTGTVANYGLITGAAGFYGRPVVANGTRYPGQLTIVNAGTISATSGAAVSLFSSNDLLIDRPGAVFNGKVIGGGGRLELAAGGSGTLGNVPFGGFSAITVDAGASWNALGTIAATATLLNLGTLTIAGGTTLTDRGVIGGGVASAITLLRGGVLSVLGTVQASTTITFGDSAGHLSLASPSTEFAPLAGFAAGDTIYLPNTPLAGLSETYVQNTGAQGLGQGTLTLAQSGSTIGELTLIGTYSTASFLLKADPNGGSDVVIPCFLAGTRIALATGEARVERLRAGMQVLTAAGALRTIVWIGHRTVDVAHHAEPEKVRPVCIAAHAFGAGQPARDLLLSPDHAIVHAGALIPVHLLINGRSIRWSRLARARYCHVELATHDVLLAEGLPVESYLDTGNRPLLGLGGGSSADAKPCLPLALRGSPVARARRHLLVHAASGSVPTPSVTLQTAGETLTPVRRSAGRLAFRLPPLTAAVTLVAHARCDLIAVVLDGQALEPLPDWLQGMELRLPRPRPATRQLDVFLTVPV